MVLLLAVLLPGLRRLTWHGAVAFGLAFGAIEAAVVSVEMFVPEADEAHVRVSPSEAAADILLTVFERVNSLPIHPLPAP